ncbi:3-phosphoserine/phosphohydroxythreonine transaminase [Crateriforma conspicua]|uniref:Phosphoserine aminotransferase n=1 Tax=Crateriforma conspicua TaxID=2527996 RepID=A0A5C5Y8E8_9PLAN|nr:3-phosphoserine/phosphohydroxythreonine transaminase [Crateriforma conspicua]QDV65693.1 Phosphoserine aminotransferase [Crateriforma conspicua]TWT71093.1 Phosphoserine aminotransferase [Crateriforma conspicua]
MSSALTDSAQQRVFNFSAGPAALPLSVLEEVRDELVCYPGAGASIMEISHRDKRFVDLLHDAQATLRQLLGISDDYEVLFLQGGAALQFSMIPANLLRGTGKTAQYLLTGSWGKKAIKEAKKEGAAESIYDAGETNYDRLPAAGDYQVADDAAYLYYCSNETIQGVQFTDEPACPDSVPLVSDASSDFLCRPLDISKYGLLYACAQKNAGPAGVTVVVVRKDLLQRSPADLPGYLNYNNHAEADSEWNTPPTFAIYVLGKIAKWLRDDIGGLDAMLQQNQEKSQTLYQVIDQSNGFYRGHAQTEARSLMNVTFNLPNDDLQASFIAEAAKHDLTALKGHRSVGGIRASIYNAMPVEGVNTLANFMKDFAKANG